VVLWKSVKRGTLRGGRSSPSPPARRTRSAVKERMPGGRKMGGGGEQDSRAGLISANFLGSMGGRGGNLND